MAQWKYVRLGDECLVERGGSPRPIENYITTDESGINWIKIGDTTDSMFITSTAQKIIPEGQKKSRNVFKGDFLLSNSMSFGRPYILKIDGCIHDGWLVIRDEKNLFDKHFLYYFLSAPKTYEHLKSLAVGGVVNNLNTGMVKNLLIPLPTIQEQREIASKFDKLEHLIALRKQQLSKLDQLVKARFVEMFEGDFSRIKLGDVFHTTSGGTPSKSRPEYYENGTIPWLTSGEINRGLITSVNNYISVLGLKNSSAKIIPSNSVVIAMYGATAGQVGLLKVETTTNQAVCAILPHPQYVPEFLFYAISQEKDWMVQQSAGGAQPNISQTIIKRMELISPPYSLQEEFAAFVQKVDKTKMAVKQSLEKLETLKKSLMQEYFG